MSSLSGADGHWKWSNLQVLEEWERRSNPNEADRETVYRALFETAQSDKSSWPGSPVPSLEGSPPVRMIHTPCADIYFTTAQRFWNADQSILFLFDIIDL